MNCEFQDCVSEAKHIMYYKYFGREGHDHLVCDKHLKLASQENRFNIQSHKRVKTNVNL